MVLGRMKQGLVDAATPVRDRETARRFVNG
jgi:hypothetical protein